jgi:hypothetical protein
MSTKQIYGTEGPQVNPLYSEQISGKLLVTEM